MSDTFVSSLAVRPDSLVNFVQIIVSPNPLQPVPSSQIVQDATSQDNYGLQGISIEGSLLATDDDANLLADYLIRPDPNFWFTGLGIEMARLTTPQRDVIATLDIGSLVTVKKKQKFGTPSEITKTLFVEGIEHRITSSGHQVALYFSPVGFFEEWQDVTATLRWQDVAAGLSWTNLIYTTL
jgi:hypothetical protein